MRTTQDKLNVSIWAALRQREDVLPMDTEEFNEDQPPVMGLIRKKFTIKRVWDESVFQPFEKLSEEDHLVAFCVETRLDKDGRMAKPAQRWYDYWVKMGGLHVVANSVEMAFDGLGLGKKTAP